jgi:hypothetical protein
MFFGGALVDAKASKFYCSIPSQTQEIQRRKGKLQSNFHRSIESLYDFPQYFWLPLESKEVTFQTWDRLEKLCAIKSFRYVYENY